MTGLRKRVSIVQWNTENKKSALRRPIDLCWQYLLIIAFWLSMA